MENRNPSKEFRDSLSVYLKDSSDKLKKLEELGVIEKNENQKSSALSKARSFIKSSRPKPIKYDYENENNNKNEGEER